jgi:tRNA-dihydrouridine synthase B
MEGISDRIFRRMVRSVGGCGLTVTEFVASEALTRDVPKAWKSIAFDDDEHPVAAQIYGRDPERMADAARRCEDAGADIVDLNFGCPSKKVTQGLAGAALMREPQLAHAIMVAVRQAIRVPMTVKMRLGWSRKTLNAPELARMAEAEGAAQIVVHGRTREQGYSGRADWSAVRAVKDSVKLPVLVNGDILNVEDAATALQESAADGVMVGRGVLRNPWLLAQIAAAQNGLPVPEPSLQQRRAWLERFLDEVEAEIEKPSLLLGRTKMITGYFCRGLRHAAATREAVYKASTAAEARQSLLGFFDRCIEEEQVFARVDYGERDWRLRGDSARSLQPPDEVHCK